MKKAMAVAIVFFVLGAYILHHSQSEWSPSFCGRRQGSVCLNALEKQLI